MFHHILCAFAAVCSAVALFAILSVTFRDEDDLWSAGFNAGFEEGMLTQRLNDHEINCPCDDCLGDDL